MSPSKGLVEMPVMRSLTAKSLLSALVPVALVLTTTAIIASYAFDRVAQDVVKQRDTELAAVSAARLSEGLSRYSRLLQEIAYGDDVRSMEPARLNLVLEEAQNLRYVFDAGLAVYDSEGLALAPRQGMDFPIPSKLDEMRNTLRPVFSDVFQDAISGEDVMLTGVPIQGGDGELKGVLAGMSTIKYSLLGGMFAEMLEFRAGRTGYAYLVDGNGQVIYHRHKSQAGGSLADTDPVTRVIQGKTGAVLTEDTTGETVISGFAPVPGTGWGLVTQERWDVVMGPIRRYGTLLLWILIVGGVVSCAVVFIFTRQVLRPIRDLTRGAERIAAGDFDHPVVVRSGDEIEILARRFNDMAASLEESFAELENRLVERKRAEEALAHERDLLQSLMDNIPDFIYFKDRDSRFTRINKAQAQFLELREPREALGKTDADFFTPEHAREAYGDEQRIIESGQPLVAKWERSTRQDGRFRWVMTTKVPVRDREGRITGIVGISTDVTERKQAEDALQEYSDRLEEMVEDRTQELQDAQEQLVRREKLAILGQWAGGVGHELRNPLGVISNAVYYLKMTLSDADQTTKEYLDMISSEVRTSTKIVSDLLDFSRTRPAQREENEVTALVARVLDKHPPPEEVQVTTEISPDLPAVLVDPQQIELVLGNLVTNAYQAMPDGGQLTFTARSTSLPDEEEKAVEDAVSLSITDTGCGISEANMKKLFEPLFTTKARGIGLGLALSRNLVEANGGTIEVESPSTGLRTSDDGKGSTFTVRLPTATKGEKQREEIIGSDEEAGLQPA